MREGFSGGFVPMYLKFVSLILATCTGELVISGAQSPSDPLFLFISNNPFVLFARIILTFVLLYIAFKGRFKYKISQKLVGYTGVCLVAIGLVGMSSQYIIDLLGTYIKFSDFVLAATVGFGFMVSALTFKVGRRRVHFKKSAVYRYPRAVRLKLINT